MIIIRRTIFLVFTQFLLLNVTLVSANSVTDGVGRATLQIENNWGSGYCATVVIENRGNSNISSWELRLDLNNSRLNNVWNAVYSSNRIRPLSYNARINPGRQVDFGFCGVAKGANYLPRLSLLDVNGGGSGSSASSSSTSASSSSSNSSTSASSSSSSSGSQLACSGYATRYWDCCKAHCSWSGNTPSSVAPLPSCSIGDNAISDVNATSSCDGGDAHMCQGLIPWKINNNLSYGFAATSSGDVCGRCYEIEFTGQSHNVPGDPGALAIQGKRMIVQATNIGYDVAGGQFDLLVPGGGVGAFNACSAQWGVSNSELGAQYGGFLTACKQQYNYNGSHQQYKSCLLSRCDSVFGSRGLSDLQQGCRWYADWFQAADNPELKYKEVACPAAIVNRSGVDRRPLSDIRNRCD